MKAHRQSERNYREAGSALLIAIFALLLISVVGIALLISTGADNALAGNYRTSTAAYYAASAGLEEARGRLLRRNPSYIGDTLSSYLAADIHNVLYIVNPAGSETVNPLDTTSPYADLEYNTEFLPNWGLASGANVYTPYVASVSPVPGSPTIPGPLYKWVRINPVTADALKLDVNSSGNPPPYNSTTPLYFDGTGLNFNSTGVQALEITAFAYMPDKSTKILQYLVAPLDLNLPAALTLDGNGVTYAGPMSTNSNLFFVSGNDPTSTSTPPGSCNSPPQVPALGYTNSGDYGNVYGGTSPNQANYTGLGYAPAPPTPAAPSVGQINTTLPGNFQKPSTLDALVQTISRNADVTINGPATGSNMPASMSSSNPMVVVVNGDLDLSGWYNAGYGLLLVTGKMIYDPDVSWEGIILVIGNEGDPVTFAGVYSGSGRIDGAVLVAQTRNATGTLLPDPDLGPASVSFNYSDGTHPIKYAPTTSTSPGIYYNTCTITQAESLIGYQVLSFREITPP